MTVTVSKEASNETSTVKPADSPPDESFTAKNRNSPQTPKTMAAAAYTTAVEERKQKDQEEKKRQHNNDKQNDGEKRARIDNDNTPFEKEVSTHHQTANQWHDRDISHEVSHETDAQDRLTETWNYIEDKHMGVCTIADFDKAVERTTALVLEEVEATLRDGLEAYYGFDSASRELTQTKDLAESRGREVSRLQALEAQSRTSVSVRSLKKLNISACKRYTILTF
jgi:hypothetical protein